MTIFDYSSLPTIVVPFILRDEDNIPVGIKVRNQETKEEMTALLGLGFVLSLDGWFSVDITELLVGVNANTTFSVEAYDSSDNPVYRDIVVFSTRLDVEGDYEQNDEDNEYIFA